MKKMLFLQSLLFICSGCANPYSTFYIDFTEGVSPVGNPAFIIPTEKPKLIQGSNYEKDCIQMAENGYICLGVSSFNSKTINQNLAVEHAKKVYAHTVIVYGQYTHSVSGSLPLTMPNTQTSYHSGSIYGAGGGFASYSGSSTTYGTRTTFIPYNVDKFDYFATFWIKLKQITLGVFTRDLTDELRRKIESNKGVYIIAVVKGSPAFNNDLLTGDIIRKIDNIDITDADHFANIIRYNKGRKIELEIFRDGKTLVKAIQLN